MYKCGRSECKSKFTLKNNMYRHQKTCTLGEIVADEKPQLQCANEWCKKTFPTLFNLNRHKEICKVPEKQQHVCTVGRCVKTFPSASKLPRHLTTHKTKPEHVCDGCSKSYTRDSIIINDISSHAEAIKWSTAIG